MPRWPPWPPPWPSPRAVAPLLPDHQVGLAWPNDVLIGPRKLSGILIEGLRRRAARRRHRHQHQQLAGRRPARAARAGGHAPRPDRPATGPDADPHRPAGAFRAELRRPGLPTAPRIAALADALCLQHGRTSACNAAGRRSRGVCRGIAPDGALRLETAAGQEFLYSGVLVCRGAVGIDFVAFRSAKAATFAERKATPIDSPILTSLRRLLLSRPFRMSPRGVSARLATCSLGFLGSGFGSKEKRNASTTAFKSGPGFRPLRNRSHSAASAGFNRRYQITYCARSPPLSTVWPKCFS